MPIIPDDKILSTSHFFGRVECYVLKYMMKFKKDRISLLKVLRDLVTENIDAAAINVFSEKEISDYMAEVTDKKHARHLKAIRRELDKLIEEVKSETRLQEQERLYNESKLQETMKNAAEHFNADQ